MVLRSSSISNLLDEYSIDNDDPFILSPEPDTDLLKQDGSSSVDLRLGTWFRVSRTSRHTVLDIGDQIESSCAEDNITKAHYVPFGRKFILHPNSFVLAVTLEWVRIPFKFAAAVMGKSSWGRRGLIIETAPIVHPGYSGCLTLELTNLGDIPIALYPGTKICQLSLNELDGESLISERAAFVGKRKPIMGSIKLDDFAKKLMNSN